MRYGLPYKGSKNRIAKWVVDYLPASDTFVDLFCGGCAVTHAAMISGKYKNFIINDINPMMPEAFKKAVSGGFRDEKRWISREDFSRLKDTDPYVAICFSFGSDLRTYAYGTDKELLKRAYHYAIVFDDWAPLYGIIPETLSNHVHAALYGVQDITDRRIIFFREIGKNRRGHVEELQSLESLERLERLERLQTYSYDYKDVPLPADCVVYCDPPYSNLKKEHYGVKFDAERFYSWALNNQKQIFISEYNMPQEFCCIGTIEKTCSLAAYTTKKTTEKLYTNK